MLIQIEGKKHTKAMFPRQNVTFLPKLKGDAERHLPKFEIIPLLPTFLQPRAESLLRGREFFRGGRVLR